MEPIGGDLADHDHEFEEVRWVGFDEADSILTFETERMLVSKAAATLELAGGELAPAEAEA
jgi:hypothetical protein